MSHPAWVCGLKRTNLESIAESLQSHPAWVCGLKHTNFNFCASGLVTPCVGVWIETGNSGSA